MTLAPFVGDALPHPALRVGRFCARSIRLGGGGGSSPPLEVIVPEPPELVTLVPLEVLVLPLLVPPEPVLPELVVSPELLERLELGWPPQCTAVSAPIPEIATKKAKRRRVGMGFNLTSLAPRGRRAIFLCVLPNVSMSWGADNYGQRRNAASMIFAFVRRLARRAMGGGWRR